MSSKFKTRYNYRPVNGLVNTMESKTFQECKDDCDINILYRKYLSKGLTPPNILAMEAKYADITESKTMEEILNVQNDVMTMFNELPSEIRQACDYKVDTFMELISNEYEDKQVKDLQIKVFDKLGMLERKQTLYAPKIEELPIKNEDTKPVLPPIKEGETEA